MGNTEGFSNSFKVALRDLFDLLKCMKCSKVLETRELSCLHKICLPCLSPFIKGLVVKCPLCRKQDSKEKLIKDALLNEMVVFEKAMVKNFTEQYQSAHSEFYIYLNEGEKSCQNVVRNFSSGEISATMLHDQKHSNVNEVKKKLSNKFRAIRKCKLKTLGPNFYNLNLRTCPKTFKEMTVSAPNSKKKKIIDWLNDESNQFEKITQTQSLVPEENLPLDYYEMPSISQNPAQVKLNNSKKKNQPNEQSLKATNNLKEKKVQDIRIDDSKQETGASDKEVSSNSVEYIYLTKNPEKKKQNSWKNIRNLRKSVGITKNTKLKKLDISLQSNEKKMESSFSNHIDVNRMEEYFSKKMPEVISSCAVSEAIPALSQIQPKTGTDNRIPKTEGVKLADHVSSEEIIFDSLTVGERRRTSDESPRSSELRHVEIQTEPFEPTGTSTKPNQIMKIESEVVNKIRAIISEDSFPKPVATIFEIILDLISDKSVKSMSSKDAAAQTNPFSKTYNNIGTQTEGKPEFQSSSNPNVQTFVQSQNTSVKADKVFESQFDELIVNNIDQLEQLEKSGSASLGGKSVSKTPEVVKSQLKTATQKRLNESLTEETENVRVSGLDEILNQWNTEPFSVSFRTENNMKNNTQNSRKKATDNESYLKSQKSQFVNRENHVEVTKNIHPSRSKELISKNAPGESSYNLKRFVRDDFSVVFETESMDLETENVCSQIMTNNSRNQISPKASNVENSNEIAKHEVINTIQKCLQKKLEGKLINQNKTKGESSTQTHGEQLNESANVLKHCEELIERANAELGIVKNGKSPLKSNQICLPIINTTEEVCAKDTQGSENKDNSQDLLDHYNNLIAVATKNLGKDDNSSKSQQHTETEYDDDFFHKLEMLEKADEEKMHIIGECTPKRKSSDDGDDEKQSKKIKMDQHIIVTESNNSISSSDNELSDIDVIETTPQKPKNRRSDSSISSHSSKSKLQLPAGILPQPIVSNDFSEENKVRNLLQHDGKAETTNSLLLELEKKSFEFGRKPLSSSNLNLRGAPEISGVKPIANDKESSSSTQKIKLMNIIDLVQQNNFSPLDIRAKLKSNSSLSSPMQKSILNYITSSPKSSQENKSNCSTPSQQIRNSQKPCIMYTQLNKEEVLLVRTLHRMKMARLAKKYIPEVTHLVVSVNENNFVGGPTIKYVQAIAAGLWIVSPKWVQECLNQSKIVDEAPYEAVDSSGVTSPNISRLTRLARPLFKNYSFFLDEPLPCPSEEIQDVITLLGGEVLTQMDEFKKRKNSICVILRQDDDTVPDVDGWELYRAATIDVQWLILSVCRYEILSFKTFILCPDEDEDMSKLETFYPHYLLEDVPNTLTQAGGVSMISTQAKEV